MKLLIYADAHFSLNSSILVGSSNSLNGKLDHLINSFKWMYELARSERVDNIIDLGDLVDSYILRAEEITAVTEALSYNRTIPEYHILGNHERLSNEGTINSVNFLNNIDNNKLITEVSQGVISGLDATFIPYGIYETGDFDNLRNTKYAFSHIDIFGADTGGWSLKSGLDPMYIIKKFDLTINGHIHNNSWVVQDKILNLGSITGHNFSSKGSSYIGILDTDTSNIRLIENPYALKFITISGNTISDIINKISNILGNYCVLQVKVPVSLVDDTREVISQHKNIISSRIITTLTKSELGNISYDEIDKVNSIEGGFKQLVEFVNSQENLPYNKDDIYKVITEIEENKLV